MVREKLTDCGIILYDRVRFTGDYHSLSSKSGVPKAPPKTTEYRSYRKYDKSSFIKDLKETDWNMVDFKVMSILLWKCGTPCLLMLRTYTRRSRRPVLKEQNHLG